MMEKLVIPDSIKYVCLTVGETFSIETPRVTVAPPYLMLMPFVEYDKGLLEYMGQRNFEGEGIHGCTYRFRTISKGKGVLGIGFTDIQNSRVTHRNEIKYETVLN